MLKISVMENNRWDLNIKLEKCVLFKYSAIL